MRVSDAAGWVGQYDGAAGAEIEIAIGEIQLIERREVVRNVQIGAGDGKFKETVSITADGRVKSAVAGNKINVAISVGGRRTAALPDAAQAAIWSCVEDALSLEGLGGVAQYPAVIRAIVAMGCISDVHDAIVQQKAGTIHLAQSIERNVAIGIMAIAGARDNRLNDHWAAKFLRARTEIQSVEPMDIIGRHACASFGSSFAVERGGAATVD